MALLRVLEFIFILVIIMGLVTQVIIPFFWGGAVFPIFRKRAKVLGEIVEAEEELAVKELIRKRDELLNVSPAQTEGPVVSEVVISDPVAAVVPK